MMEGERDGSIERLKALQNGFWLLIPLSLQSFVCFSVCGNFRARYLHQF